MPKNDIYLLHHMNTTTNNNNTVTNRIPTDMDDVLSSEAYYSDSLCLDSLPATRSPIISAHEACIDNRLTSQRPLSVAAPPVPTYTPPPHYNMSPVPFFKSVTAIVLL